MGLGEHAREGDNFFWFVIIFSPIGKHHKSAAAIGRPPD